MSHWAAPGVKCVCIDDEPPRDDRAFVLHSRIPMLNEVLTISRVEIGCFHNGDEGICLLFDEIPVIYDEADGFPWMWDATAFRPLTVAGKSAADDVALFSGALRTLEKVR